MARSLKAVIWLLAGGSVGFPNYGCHNSSPLAAVIADSGSTESIAIARWLGLYRYPQISYFASSTLLSDRLQFPSFFRTIPSDDFQARSIARLVVHFGWTWVGLLSTENDYGQLGSQILKEELSKSGICIAFHETIPLIAQNTQIGRVVDKVMKSTANVILVFSSDPYLWPVIERLYRLNASRKIWVASEGWSTASIVSAEDISTILRGTVGFAIQKGEMPGFREFLFRLQPSVFPNDPFIKRFWEYTFACQWPSLEINSTILYQVPQSLCTGHEDLKKFSDPYFGGPDLRISYAVYNAVYAVAHALKAMKSCAPGYGPFINDTCTDIQKVRPWEVLHYIKSVRFNNKDGEEMFFDHQGNPPDRYDIINWQGHSDGAIKYVKIGSIMSAVSKGHDMYVNDSAIQWGMPTAEVPQSVCSESCAPGYRKAAQDGRPACCFDCIRCSEGEISNETGSSKCWPCPEDQWSNEGRNTCIPKNIEFLLYLELLGIMLSSVAIGYSFKTIAILVIFIKYANTPVVKANNRELTYLVLGALLLSFLCSFLFIGQPQTITCLLRQPAFGIIFALCISCVLAKTIMVIIAFKATKPGCNMRRWLGPHVPVVTVLGSTLLQVLICITWLLLCPPFSEKNMKMKTETIIFQCNECSETALWCMIGYLGLLACVSFLVAFLARTLPDCFNEAKWITFSMIVFLSVWLSFIPGYISTQGKYVVAVEVFAIISSSAGLLSCIFFPKCYIILLRPDLNTRRHLLGKGTSRNKKIKNV
ncbi:extracellular calcium-sensing receptor-like [Pleurodeles waltl]|uniref:extracellular calcium-sensing receptor-like n=1 Tax=Pleurodeles waltl TaxID=8319 RepID=UPI003709642F